MSGRSFVRGALILSAASLLCKALSALFKIPLDRFLIGPDGLAVYQSAYSIYNWMLAVGATGIPIAVSNLVADSDETGAAGIRSSALALVTGAGALIGGLLFVFARPIAEFIGEGGSAFLGIRVMAPAIMFLGIISSYKGYFQGRGNMLPSAVSQIVDSLCKALAGLGICALMLPYGTPAAAAGAMGGVTLGTVMGASVLLIFGKKYITLRRPPSRKLMWRIVTMSVPVTLGAAGFACIMLADTLTVQRILTASGMTPGAAEVQFGYLNRAVMIYNLPATLISAVSMSVAPACAEACRNGDMELLRNNTVSALRLILFISAPCMLGVMCFPNEIISLLFGGTGGGEALMFTGLLMLLVPFTQVLSGILQATGCVWKPIWVLLFTVGLKTVLNFVFVPVMGVAGAPFGAAFAYLVGSAALVLLFYRHHGFGFPVGTVIRPLTAAGAGAVCGRLLYGLLGVGTANFLVSAAVMGAVYVVLAFLIKAVDPKTLRKK